MVKVKCRKGRLQLTLMDGKTQSYQLNLKDYHNKQMVMFEIDNLRLNTAQKVEAKALANEWFKRKK